MRLLVADTTSRQWITDLIFLLLKNEEYEYAFTFHGLSVVSVNRPFAMYNGIPIPAAVCLSDTMKITVLIYYPLVSRLSHQSQLAILKHELLHVVEGHMSSYGMRLTEDYGQEIANIGKDLYVNQRLSNAEVQGMAADGFPLYMIETYGFPKGLSSEQYCQLFQDGVSNGTIERPEAGVKTLTEADGVPSGTPGSPGDDFDGKGQMRPTEVFDVTKNESLIADQATRELIHGVTETLEARGKEWRQARGFGGSDRDAFVEASKRHSQVPWHYFLRVMESKQRTEEVVPTRSRLSRRCSHHMGRVRRNGLDVAFMVDTSGSMGGSQLRLVDAELRGMSARGAHITVIHCDAHVAKVEEYSPFMTMERFHGRGGTDFSPALLYTWDMYPSPSMFVGFTDGAGGIEAYVEKVRESYGDEWYDEFAARKPSTTPDGIEAIWLIPEDCMTPEAFTENICPWGQVLVVPSELEVQKQK